MVVTLTSVFKGDTFYEKTVREFHENWDDIKGPHPHITHVYKVSHRNDRAAKYHNLHKDYCRAVGNVQYLFHGTTRVCRLGDHRDWTTLCDHPACSLCSILAYSYDFNRAGSANGKMFGKGVYTTEVTSKAAQYCESIGMSTRSKVMLLSKVAVGNTCLMRRANHDLTAPPRGFDSVTGATKGQGGTLNYPETVVYRPDAICVVGIIVFQY